MPGWKPGAFATRPRAHIVDLRAEGEGVEPIKTLLAFNRFPSGRHRLLACPSIFHIHRETSHTFAKAPAARAAKRSLATSKATDATHGLQRTPARPRRKCVLTILRILVLRDFKTHVPLSPPVSGVSSGSPEDRTQHDPRIRRIRATSPRLPVRFENGNHADTLIASAIVWASKQGSITKRRPQFTEFSIGESKPGIETLTVD